MTQRRIGPDAARYLAAAQDVPVPRPFHLRWLLPWACGTNLRHWWIVWAISWPIAAGAMFAWRLVEGDAWQFALAATACLLALPGILGPSVVIPVGVDLPATAVSLVATALAATGQPHMIAAAVVLVAWGSGIRETVPVWSALWAWSPWLLIGLVPVVIRALVVKPGADPLGETFQRIADHPIRTALEHHRGQWRNAWVMVAPWGIGVAALIDPSVQTIVALTAAYALLLVATDTVRLLHHSAGPVVCAAAVAHIPVQWLLFAVVLHALWFRVPERV
jgi:hypothetical protein